MTESKAWDKHDIIMSAFDIIEITAKRSLREDDKNTNSSVIAGSACIIGEIVVQDLHRIAAANERIADALESISANSNEMAYLLSSIANKT